MILAFEKLLGCLWYDRRMSLRRATEAVSFLLSRARLPDIDTDISQDFFGTMTVSHYLEELISTSPLI